MTAAIVLLVVALLAAGLLFLGAPRLAGRLAGLAALAGLIAAAVFFDVHLFVQRAVGGHVLLLLPAAFLVGATYLRFERRLARHKAMRQGTDVTSLKQPVEPW